MAMLHPPYVSPMQWFFPMGQTAAVSLTQDLPPGKQANCLVLGNGDARNILFTLFNEQNSGFSRVYDFTCCDVEPAILARNILLFSILMDNVNTKESVTPDYWSIFYDLHVDTQTFETIRKHARVLVAASKDMTSWTSSPYNPVLHIINTETLSTLNEYWTKYATYVDADRTHYYKFRAQCKRVYESTPVGFTTQTLQTLVRSFGPRLWNAMNLTEHYANYFWKSGSLDKPSRPNERQCNPLAVFSAVAGDRFSVHYRTNPLAGFHLAAALTELTPDAQLALTHEKTKQKVLGTAKMEFKAWCMAFQKIAKATIEGKSKTGRLRLRFFVGDAVNFCHAMNQLRTSHTDEFNAYSRPWSSTPLRLDGPGFPNGFDRAPLSFNVIDAGNLADDVGFLNILTATIPLLEPSAAAVLYTESMKSYPPQSNLLAELLCTEDIPSMCALLGVVPAPYVTGISTRAVDEAYVDDTQPIFNRINWKIATSLDPQIIPAETKISADPKTLAKLLYDVYLEMFAHESGRYRDKVHTIFSNSKGRFRFPQPHYSRGSYAAFLAFLKPRVCIDWTDLMETLIKLMEKEGNNPRFVGRNNLSELSLQLHLFGVYSQFPYDEIIYPFPECIDKGAPVFNRHDPGLLEPSSPVRIGCLILTVPRRKLRVLYKSCVDDGHRANMVFQMHLQAKGVHETFTSLHPVFGKLTTSSDGSSCEIERDASGWFGQSDLHLCVLVPTWLLLMTNPKEVEISLQLYHEYSVMLLMNDVLPPFLEVFRARLLSTEYVHLCKSFPGLKAPTPTPIDPVKSNVAFTNDSHEITFPSLTPGTQTFTTRVTIKSKVELERLANGATVDVGLFSSSTVLLTCEKFKYTCRLPFPVASQGLRVRVARKSGWIEIISRLLPAQVSGLGIEESPLPLVVRDKRYGLCTWNMPYLNFNALPKIAKGEYKKMQETWFRLHLLGMFSDYEAPLVNVRTSLLDKQRHGCLFEFKESLLEVFEIIASGDPSKPIVFNITPIDSDVPADGPLLFFATGLYLDTNSNSVVAEVYVVPMIPSLILNPKFFPVVPRIFRLAHIQVYRDVYVMWKNFLPAMAERCRDWEHTSACEFAHGVPDFDTEKSQLCSCGVGKGEKVFAQSTWKEAASFATRIAISPLYVAGYLESAKGGPLSQNTMKRLPPAQTILSTRKQRKEKTSVPEKTCEKEKPVAVEAAKYVFPEVVKCQDCGKDGAKKCGACGEVYYCSRECQKRDWKKHRAACQKIQAEQAG